jgi:N-acetylmuramoyl-L-alanine amidase
VNIPTKIIIHASATDDDPKFSWGAIRKYHIEHNEWDDIGYHAGCELVGDHYEVLYGRPWIEAGAHCPTQNTRSLGFCFVGDFMTEPPPQSQILAALPLLRDWMRLYSIPKEEVHPHREFNNTDCPGDAFDIEALRRLL